MRVEISRLLLNGSEFLDLILTGLNQRNEEVTAVVFPFTVKIKLTDGTGYKHQEITLTKDDTVSKNFSL